MKVEYRPTWAGGSPKPRHEFYTERQERCINSLLFKKKQYWNVSVLAQVPQKATSESAMNS